MVAHQKSNSNDPVALITGGARRIGAAIAQALHAVQYRVLIHYRHSYQEAAQLCAQLNTVRADSAAMVQADFAEFATLEPCIQAVVAQWGRLDVIVNNASSFFPTTVGETTLEQWQQLMASNLLAPYFLVQAALPALLVSQGRVINITDIHGERPLKGYAVYSAAKAGLMMLTKALARELGPTIQVNAIAPGPTLWAEHQTKAMQPAVVARSVLKRMTAVEDITRAVLFLLQQTSMTGEIIHLDCGRLLK